MAMALPAAGAMAYDVPRREPVPAKPVPPGRTDLKTEGRIGRLLLIALKNLALSIVTLGLYSFWGRARVRRYLWGTTLFRGEPLEYSGTGGELFRGALVVLFLVFVPAYVAAGVLDHVVLDYPIDTQAFTPGNGILVVAFLYLSGLASFRAARYRLTRTSWRGIRGGMEGDGWSYANAAFGYTLLSLLTLGLTGPVGDVALAKRFYRAVWLGDRPIEFEARAKALYPRYLACWLLLLPTLGLSMFWYLSARERQFAAGRRWAGMGFHFTGTGGGLLGLTVTNILLVVFTLGLGGPAASLRYLRFMARHTRFTGELDLAALGQNARPAPARGEGLASMLDVDAL